MMIKVCILLGVSLLLLGCNPVARRDARDRNKRMVSRAYEELEAGDAVTAARLFQEALDAHPTLARPHLDLALILHDHQHDYIRAIYHYQRYLALRPGTEKQEMILGRIQQARMALVTSLGEGVLRAADPAEEPQVDRVAQAEAAEAAVEQLQQTVAVLQQERNDLRVRSASSERLLDEQREQIIQLEGQVRRLEDQVVRLQAALATPSHTDERPSATSTAVTPAVGRQRTYEVRANDNLSAIAERVYGDANQWRLIQEANQDVLGDAGLLRIGQILVIPDVAENRR